MEIPRNTVPQRAITIVTLVISAFLLVACKRATVGPAAPSDEAAPLAPPLVVYVSPTAAPTDSAAVVVAEISASPTARTAATHPPTATFTPAAPVLPTSIPTVAAQAVVAQQDAPTPATVRSATLSQIVGPVQARASTEVAFAPASAGQVLGIGAQVQTGAGGGVRIDLTEGTILRLDENSLFEVTALEQDAANPLTRLFLFIGRIWINLTGGSLEVETAVGVAAVRGSLQEVFVVLDSGGQIQSVTISCGDGDCTYTDPNDVTTSIIPGNQAIVSPGGVTTQLIPLDQLQNWLDNNPEIAAIIQALIDARTPPPSPEPPPPADTTPPTVTKVNTSADTGDGVLSEGESTDAAITQLLVTFSEDVQNSGGGANADDVTNTANYLLLTDGANGAFDTISCAAGVGGDDGQIPINSATYDSGARTATLNVNGGNGLPVDNFRLFVCGATSIKDGSGNKLNGGADFTRSFTVTGFSIEQNGSGQKVTALTDEQSVATYYSYNSPVNSSTNSALATSSVSRIFLYSDGANVSLVMIHDKPNDGSGGSAGLSIANLPAGAGVTVSDDPDELTLTGATATGNWSWNTCCTDGGVLGPLSGTYEITVTPTAAWVGITTWEFLSGDLTNPTVITLGLNDALTIKGAP